MTISFLQVMISLVAGIVIIILLTVKFHVHAFFALMIACIIVGWGIQMPFANLLVTMKDGFGNIMRSLGFIIVLGTTLGVLLEYTGSTTVMAHFILKKVGAKNAAFAMSITGFIVGLPIFCDSAFIMLSGLNKSLAKRTGISIVIASVALASGLYAVHCLIPPHPGATAAAGTLGVNIGKLIPMGIIVAVPAMLIGYAWAKYAGKKIHHVSEDDEVIISTETSPPSVIKSFLPIIIPILLIGISSFISIDKSFSNSIINIFTVLGDPVVALSIGVLLAFNCKRSWKKNVINKLFHDAIEKAGATLMLIGAGGAFGAVLAGTHLGNYFKESDMSTLGLLFPFLLTFVLKTAQGSSTVAIITAASILQPLMPVLGLTSETQQLLCVLSMGAGSMMISHVNDAYFWVIAKFSGLNIKAMLRVYSIATALMGLVALGTVYILFLILS
jgi:gluconate:H+ symporter, GntP family